MSTFLTGKELEEKLTDIIWNAKQYVLIISPFIKLDDHVKSIFDKVKATHETHLILLFGKNERYKQKSFNKEDYDYFKEFKNISILYNKDLHAKHYCNEKEGLITSLNLYDYSMRNNIEYGVHFTKNILPTDRLFDETVEFTDELIFNKSDAVFIKKPQYKKKMFGLSKSFQNSTILFDISEDFFNGRKYKIKHLEEFLDVEFTDVDKIYDKKPQRESIKKPTCKIRPEFKNIRRNNWYAYLCDILLEELGTKTSYEFKDNRIKIQCANVFEAHISNENKVNHLNVMGVISGYEYKTLKAKPRLFKTKSKLKPTLVAGGDGFYDTVWHHSEIELNSSSIDKLKKEDYNIVIQTIFDFVVGLIIFKRDL